MSARAYLIGGVPRCGKTTIALEAVTKRPMYSIGTDAIRQVERNLFTSKEKPALFAASEKFTKSAILSGRPQEIIDAQNAESESLWPSIHQVINRYLDEGFDVLVEGVAITPAFVASLNCDYSAVFVGNTSSDHASHMLSSARSNQGDWLAKHSDETIRALAQYTNAHSEWFAEQAEKYNMFFCEYKDGGFKQYIVQARDMLLK